MRSAPRTSPRRRLILQPTEGLHSPSHRRPDEREAKAEKESDEPAEETAYAQPEQASVVSDDSESIPMLPAPSPLAEPTPLANDDILPFLGRNGNNGHSNGHSPYPAGERNGNGSEAATSDAADYLNRHRLRYLREFAPESVEEPESSHVSTQAESFQESPAVDPVEEPAVEAVEEEKTLTDASEETEATEAAPETADAVAEDEESPAAGDGEMMAFMPSPALDEAVPTTDRETPRSSGFDLAIPELAPEDVWRLVALTQQGLIPASMEPAMARTSWEETPAEFLHLFARFEQLTAGRKILGVTSALAGEGKTTVALHLALATARSTFRRVCLVDLSLGEDDLCRRIGAAPAPSGIVACLEQNHLLALLERSVPGGEILTVIPAGGMPKNPARLARSPRIAALLSALREACDLVIVDLPAVSTDNTVPLAQQMDGLILVAQAGATPRAFIEQAADAVGRDRITGVVLNRTPPQPAKKRRKG